MGKKKDFGTPMVKVIKEAEKKPDAPKVAHTYGDEVINILGTQDKNFNQGFINLADANTAKQNMEYAQDILLDLEHILEDCPLNANEMVRIAGLIKSWRRYRRYYKTLWQIQKDGFSNFKDLQRKVGQQASILSTFKEKSATNKILIFEALERKKGE